MWWAGGAWRTDRSAESSGQRREDSAVRFHSLRVPQTSVNKLGINQDSQGTKHPRRCAVRGKGGAEMAKPVIGRESKTNRKRQSNKNIMGQLKKSQQCGGEGRRADMTECPGT